MPTILESLLDPISRIEFREQYYGKRPLLVRGHPGKFAGLFTWDDLNRLLNSWSFPQTYVEVAGTKRFHPATPAALIEHCRDGASMIFSHLEIFEPKVGALARALEAETGEPTFVTMILSKPSQSAFGMHYDRDDVFVLHLDGHKAWEVYTTTHEKPVWELDAASDGVERHRILECELAPGDLLYVPRGFWHQALAQRGLSLHLSVGVFPRTGIDFLTWLVGELRNDVRFRHELPLSFAEESVELREERLRRHVGELGEMLRSRLEDAETVRSFMNDCVLSDRDVTRFKLPVQLFDAPATQLGVGHFSRSARQRFVLEDGPTADLIALSVWGHIFQFPKSARPLVEFIVSQTSFTADDARAHAGALSEEDLWEVLNPLLREGILDAALGA